MKPSRCLVLLMLAVLSGAAAADVFTWKDPQTGRTRLSNMPPAWLRDGTAGPRVEIIRDNKIIDPVTAFGSPQPQAALSAQQRARAGLPPQQPAKSAPAKPEPVDNDD